MTVPTDYIIHFTDPSNGSFIIKPFTTNGPLTPIAATPLDSSATSANTSIVLLGKGMDMYGNRMAESIVHMLEHFAYVTAPAYPRQGQIWYKNTTKELFIFDSGTFSGQQILLNGLFTSSLNVNTHKIINVGAPTLATDAATKGYVDTSIASVTANFVLKAGDTMTGNLVMSGAGVQITLPNAPVLGTDAANKTYVDTKVSKSGDIMSGILDMSSHKIINVTDPTGLQDAATKNYVDNQISGVSTGLVDPGSNGIIVRTALNVTTARSITSSDGSINITNANGVAGNPDIGVHYSLDPLIYLTNRSYLREQLYGVAGYPSSIPFPQIVNEIDREIYQASQTAGQQLFTGDGVTVVFPLMFGYITEGHELSVTVGGTKKYANDRGSWTFKVAPEINIGSTTGLAATTTYNFRITVDGGTETLVPITTGSAPVLWGDLFSLIRTAIIVTYVPVAFVFKNNALIFTSNTSGATSSVFVRDGTLPLFAALSASAIPVVGDITTGDNVVFNITTSTTGVAPGQAITELGRSGYEDVLVGGNKITASLTNLVALTTYTATITIDGVGHPISVLGSTVTTFGLLNAAITSQLGGFGSATLIGGNIRVRSYTFDGVSTVSIAAGTLFAAPLNGFAGFSGPFAGTLTTTDIQTNSVTSTVSTNVLAIDTLASATVPVVLDIAARTSAPEGGLNFLSIFDANNGTAKFRITGDYTTLFKQFNTFVVYGSTVNNADYTVTADSTFVGGKTEILVSPAPSTTGTDGYIYFTETLDYAEDGIPGSLATLGSKITFMTAPALLAKVEVIAIR